MASRARKTSLLRWDVAPLWEGADELARQLRTGRLIAQLLYNRGISTPEAARAYLSPKLSDLHDPELLPGTAEAANLILAAVTEHKPIALYGDYDVDGITGLAILHRCLKMLGATVEYYIPHRIEEGYGLNVEALETLASRGAKVLVTVDCGIGSAPCAERAAELGMMMIITDHHTPPAVLPKVACIVHPTAMGPYPNPYLCGAGVAFKLAWQLCRTACGTTRVNEQLRDFLLDATCLSALGTIADVVPLIGENRALATYGLRGLPATRHQGIQALISAAGLDGKGLSAYDVGFQLAPRLNAAGRMGHAHEAAELMIRPEEVPCAELAAALTQQNTQRQEVERAMYDQALEMVAARGLDKPETRVIVLASEGWHAGVVGIVASRMASRFGRPAVMIALDGEAGQGSARSIDGYHIAKAFEACAQHLVSHGGHAMAAGLRIEAVSVDAFTAALAQHAQQHFPSEKIDASLRVDAEITLAELTYTLAHQIETMAPFGSGNPPVMLAVRQVKLVGAPKRMGRNGNTLSLLVGQGETRVRCVGFGMGELAERLAGVQTVDIAGEPAVNRYAGRASAELMLANVHWE